MTREEFMKLLETATHEILQERADKYQKESNKDLISEAKYRALERHRKSRLED